MTAYSAPLRDMRFVIHELVGLARTASLRSAKDFAEETIDSVLEQAARFAGEVLAPLNRIGG